MAEGKVWAGEAAAEIELETSHALTSEIGFLEQRIWQVLWHPTIERRFLSCGGLAVREWSLEKEAHDQDIASDEDDSSGWVIRLKGKVPIEKIHSKTVRRLALTSLRRQGGTDTGGSTAETRLGERLALASFDGITSLWERNSSQEAFQHICDLKGHESEVKCVAFLPAPPSTSSAPATDTGTESRAGEEGGAEGDIGGGREGGSGEGEERAELAATCGRDHTVWVHGLIEERVGKSDSDNVQNKRVSSYCVSIINSHTQDVKCVKFHPSLPLLASCSYDGTMKLHAPKTALAPATNGEEKNGDTDEGDGEEEDEDEDEDWATFQDFRDHNDATVWDVAFSGDGHLLVSAGADGLINVYTIAPPRPTLQSEETDSKQEVDSKTDPKTDSKTALKLDSNEHLKEGKVVIGSGPTEKTSASMKLAAVHPFFKSALGFRATATAPAGEGIDGEGKIGEGNSGEGNSGEGSTGGAGGDVGRERRNKRKSVPRYILHSEIDLNEEFLSDCPGADGREPGVAAGPVIYSVDFHTTPSGRTFLAVAADDGVLRVFRLDCKVTAGARAERENWTLVACVRDAHSGADLNHISFNPHTRNSQTPYPHTAEKADGERETLELLTAGDDGFVRFWVIPAST